VYYTANIKNYNYPCTIYVPTIYIVLIILPSFFPYP
jgi:hypothetical protein